MMCQNVKNEAYFCSSRTKLCEISDLSGLFHFMTDKIVVVDRRYKTTHR
jgi:hypothetical protein